MVCVFGNSIVNGYTSGSRLRAIYCYGVQVWPEHYIIWTPSTLDESFSIYGTTYSMLEYSGLFTEFNGVITESAFINTHITTLDTNAYSMSSNAFASCYSLINVSASECLTLENSAFRGCHTLSNIYLPKCTYIGNYGLADLYSLNSLYAPNCQYIGAYGFHNDITLSELSMSKLSELGSNGCRACLGLSTISLPMLNSVQEHTFRGCTSLNKTYLPNCKRVDEGGFMSCTGMKSISLPLCSSIGSSVFAYCTQMSRATLPECKYVGKYAFSNCTSMSYVYLPKATSIASSAFYSTGLDLVLEGSSVCSLNGNIFGPGGFSNHMIFVPSSLVSTYISTYPSYYHPSQGTLFSSYPLFASLYYIKWTPNLYTNFNLSWSGSTYTFRMSNYNYDNYFVCPFMVNGVVDGLTITSSAFKNKPTLSTFETNAGAIWESVFYGCTGLTAVTLPRCGYIGAYAFAECTSMTSLILGSNSVCQLGGNSTAFSNNNTKIYVPSSLVTAYKNNALWSYFRLRIFAIPS